MSQLDDFETISKDVLHFLHNQPNHSDALELYSLYKQAKFGDVDISRPSLFDFKGKAKWDAWNSKKGLDKEEAKRKYINLAKSLFDNTSAQTVKNILPQVPLSVIIRDLSITNNVDQTIARLLDGTVYYQPEPESIKEPTKRHDTNKEKSKCLIHDSLNKNTLKDETKLNTQEKIADAQNPMSFNTKAQTFEKDPHLRMKSYQERKEKLLEVARAHYIQKYGLNE